MKFFLFLVISMNIIYVHCDMLDKLDDVMRSDNGVVNTENNYDNSNNITDSIKDLLSNNVIDDENLNNFHSFMVENNKRKIESNNRMYVLDMYNV